MYREWHDPPTTAAECFRFLERVLEGHVARERSYIPADIATMAACLEETGLLLELEELAAALALLSRAPITSPADLGLYSGRVLDDSEDEETSARRRDVALLVEALARAVREAQRAAGSTGLTVVTAAILQPAVAHRVVDVWGHLTVAYPQRWGWDNGLAAQLERETAELQRHAAH